MSFLLTRGQQIKVVSQIHRKARSMNLVVPVRDRVVTDEKFEGATVIEPKRGYYSAPIATLDFASLYPSIMMAHNLCYTTMIGIKEAKERLRPDQYVVTPHGDYFVTAETQKGILPLILEELLQARKVAKRAMAEATDPFMKAIQNGRQLVTAEIEYIVTFCLVLSSQSELPERFVLCICLLFQLFWLFCRLSKYLRTPCTGSRVEFAPAERC